MILAFAEKFLGEEIIKAVHLRWLFVVVLVVIVFTLLATNHYNKSRKWMPSHSKDHNDVNHHTELSVSRKGFALLKLAFTFTKLSNVMEMGAVNRLLIELAIREPKATEADWKCGVLCLRQDQRQNWGAWSQVLAQLVLFALEEHSFLSHYHRILLQAAPSSLLRNNGKRPFLLSPHVDFQM